MDIKGLAIHHCDLSESASISPRCCTVVAWSEEASLQMSTFDCCLVHTLVDIDSHDFASKAVAMQNIISVMYSHSSLIAV